MRVRQQVLPSEKRGRRMKLSYPVLEESGNTGDIFSKNTPLFESVIMSTSIALSSAM